MLDRLFVMFNLFVVLIQQNKRHIHENNFGLIEDISITRLCKKSHLAFWKQVIELF